MTTITFHKRGNRLGMTLAVATAAVALWSASAALADGPAPSRHGQRAEPSAIAPVSRIPHTAGLTKSQIARKAERHQRAINRAASESAAAAVAAPSAPGRDSLPIVLAGVALLIALGSAGALAVGGARIRRSAQPGA